jgi:hypothetical protein
LRHEQLIGACAEKRAPNPPDVTLSQVDGFVPRNQDVNLRIVCQSELGLRQSLGRAYLRRRHLHAVQTPTRLPAADLPRAEHETSLGREPVGRKGRGEGRNLNRVGVSSARTASPHQPRQITASFGSWKHPPPACHAAGGERMDGGTHLPALLGGAGLLVCSCSGGLRPDDSPRPRHPADPGGTANKRWNASP